MQVLLKVSDLGILKENQELLLNLQWILSKVSAPSAPVMNAIQFLTKVCIQVPASRIFLRDHLDLTRTLTTLLVTLASSKADKVLHLLRYVTHGITIIRQESYLEKLIFQLLRFIQAKDCHSSPSLAILACLCHNNYLVSIY